MSQALSEETYIQKQRQLKTGQESNVAILVYRITS